MMLDENETFCETFFLLNILPKQANEKKQHIIQPNDSILQVNQAVISPAFI